MICIYGGGRGRLAAAEVVAVATSADEEVVCQGEKTREKRDYLGAVWRGRVPWAVSLDE